MAKVKVTRQLMGLAAVHEQIARAIYAERGPNVLQPAQWPVLRYFSRAGEEARTVSGLAGFLGVELSTASRAANALERRGLVVSFKNPNDRRSVIYTLSDEGQKKLRDDPLQKLAVALGDLSAEDRMTFSRVMFEVSESES